jgi:hypothetical protein
MKLRLAVSTDAVKLMLEHVAGLKKRNCGATVRRFHSAGPLR